MQKLAILVAVAVLGACAAQEPGPDSTENIQACEDPRPQICTLEYAPVCGILGNQERKEFSNGCSACGNADVTGWVAGPCDSSAEQ